MLYAQPFFVQVYLQIRTQAKVGVCRRRGQELQLTEKLIFHTANFASNLTILTPLLHYINRLNIGGVPHTHLLALDYKKKMTYIKSQE